jgi:hypothetical protein
VVAVVIQPQLPAHQNGEAKQPAVQDGVAVQLPSESNPSLLHPIVTFCSQPQVNLIPAVLRIRDVCPGSEILHPGSSVKKVPHQKI